MAVINFVWEIDLNKITILEEAENMQKKIMTLWQMIILVVLLAAVTISMFFPVLNPTGKKEVSTLIGLKIIIPIKIVAIVS